MNKKYFFSHRVPAMLLTLALCLGMIPTASAAQQNSYHDPVEHWQQASNRTNELDVNAIVTHETFYCATCRENTDFTVWRVPEYGYSANGGKSTDLRIRTPQTACLCPICGSHSTEQCHQPQLRAAGLPGSGDGADSTRGSCTIRLLSRANF